jgi:hypothetical protein
MFEVAKIEMVDAVFYYYYNKYLIFEFIFSCFLVCFLLLLSSVFKILLVYINL